VRVSASAWDTDLVAVNPKYLAVNTQTSGGGAFMVVPLSKPGKLPDIYPLVRGHSAPVLDTAWSPFDDNLIASGGEDSKVNLTRIDEDALQAAWTEGVDVNDIMPLHLGLSHGGRKCGNVQWHPTAAGLLASASSDIRLWDIENQTAAITLQAHPDMVQSFSFNSTGALLATTCKDKKLRIFDVRASTAPVQTTESHTGVKGSRVCWLGTLDRIVTTGFSRMSDRQVFLWNAGQLDRPLKQLTIDTSSGTLMPFWSDNNVLFLAGKGDGNVRYYEYDSDDLIYLTEHKSSEPQRGMTFMPRRGLNVAECEIAKAYKVRRRLRYLG
jgi:coronin-1B/1C/6